MKGKSNLNMEIGGVRIENVATKIGGMIDAITGGVTNAEKQGKRIDKATEWATIVFKN